MVDGRHRKLIFTHKKTLVKSSLPLILDYNDAKPGMFSHGVVSGVRSYGVFVSFYKHVRGLVSINHLSSAEKITNPASYFTPGKVVKARVLSARPEEEKIKLSLRASDEGLGPTESGAKGERESVDIPSGSRVDVEVLEVTAHALKVAVPYKEGTVKASIPAYQLSGNLRVL